MREYLDSTDDRGVAVRVPVSGDRADARAHELTRGQRRWLRVRRDKLRGSRQPMGTLAFLGLCAAVVLAAPFALAALAILAWTLAITGWFGLPIVVLAGVLLVWMIRSLRAHARERDGIDTAVCVACAYPLDGVPVDESGIAECPECGGAWKVSTERADTCSACGYPLGALQEDRRGSVICPECGVARLAGDGENGELDASAQHGAAPPA